MSKRINVTISDSMNEKLDNYGERYGIGKSSVVGFVIGQWLDQMDQMNGAVFGVTGKDGFVGEIMKGIVADKEDIKND